MTEVDIAISCYNAEPWLDDMFASIERQSGARWRIVAFDDGSRDRTGEILAAWQEKLGPRMVVAPNPERANLGVSMAYSTVLGATTAPFVLLADADDIWLPGHLASVVGALKDAELRLGSAHPVVACTDARVVDEHQAVLSESFWRWDGCDPRRVTRPTDVAMENPVLSPTMGMNRALLQLALPIPRQAWCQDWWLAMVASGFGAIRVVDDVTTLYRRHGANYTGRPIGSVRRALSSLGATRRRIRQLLDQRGPLARAFVERYGSRLSRRESRALIAIGQLSSSGPLRRRALMLRHRLSFASPLKTIGMFLLC